MGAIGSSPIMHEILDTVAYRINSFGTSFA